MSLIPTFSGGIPVAVRGKFTDSPAGSIGRFPMPYDSIGAATITFTGLPVGTDIVVLVAGTSDVLHQVDAHSGTSYEYMHDVFIADSIVDIGFICPGYEIQYVRNLTLPRNNAVLPIALRADRNFQ